MAMFYQQKLNEWIAMGAFRKLSCPNWRTNALKGSYVDWRGEVAVKYKLRVPVVRHLRPPTTTQTLPRVIWVNNPKDCWNLTD
jgi:hypothetical protein